MNPIKYGSYYKNSKGDMYKALNPVKDLINPAKLIQKVLFMSINTGVLYTMSEADFNKRFKEVTQDAHEE